MTRKLVKKPTTAAISPAASGALSPLPTAGANAYPGAPCPAAEPLVPIAQWRHYTLKPGVVLYEGRAIDRNGAGRVQMHVLRIDVTHPGVSTKPLMGAVADRAPLTALVAGRDHVVAATNTGYFDFVTGAPTQPLVVNAHPLVISARPQHVIGFGDTGVLQTGTVSLGAQIDVDGEHYPVKGINDVDAGGILPFYSSWGKATIPIGPRSTARSVVGNRLGPTTVSMVSLVDPEDPTVRTLKVVRRAADGRAYADALAARYGLSRDRLVRRLQR